MRQVEIWEANWQDKGRSMDDWWTDRLESEYVCIYSTFRISTGSEINNLGLLGFFLCFEDNNYTTAFCLVIYLFVVDIINLRK